MQDQGISFAWPNGNLLGQYFWFTYKITLIWAFLSGQSMLMTRQHRQTFLIFFFRLHWVISLVELTAVVSFTYFNAQIPPTMHGNRKQFQQAENCWVSSGQVLKTILVTHLHKSGHCYCLRLARNACHFDFQADNEQPPINKPQLITTSANQG